MVSIKYNVSSTSRDAKKVVVKSHKDLKYNVELHVKVIHTGDQFQIRVCEPNQLAS